MAAWFNYYLYVNTNGFDCLYGAEANRDIACGLVERRLDTAPQHVHAAGQAGTVLLEWALYPHPVVAGYFAYRRQAGEAYPDVPQIHMGRTGRHLDMGLARGQVYFYVLCSHDGAGQEHQRSPEVSARTPGEPNPHPDLDERLYLPHVVSQ